MGTDDGERKMFRSASDAERCGARGRSRTDDLPLTRRLLWPLSYAGSALRRALILPGAPSLVRNDHSGQRYRVTPQIVTLTALGRLVGPARVRVVAGRQDDVRLQR